MDFPAELIEAKRVAEVAWEKVRRAVMLPESTEAAITLDQARAAPALASSPGQQSTKDGEEG